MSGQSDVTVAAIRKLADDLDTVASTLEEAKGKIEEAEVGGSSFSHYGLDMQIAYPSAHAFMLRNLAGKIEHVKTVQTRLRSTAQTWEDAETQSTMSCGSGVS